MRLGRKTRERQLSVDMTPMIDIVFQLLIFFLVTAQMVNLSRADVQLPKEQGEQSKQADAAGLIINMLADGAIVISDQPVDLEALEALVAKAIDDAPQQKAEQVKLTIRADRRAPASRLNAVIERLHKLGVGAARIATAPER